MNQLILITGEYHKVTDEEILAYQQAYRNIDVFRELDKMQAWLASNPQKRKTGRGIKRFVNAWLSRADETGSVPLAKMQGGVSKHLVDVSWLDPQDKAMMIKSYLSRFGCYWDGQQMRTS